MYRLTELIGRPVLSLADGRHLGEVHDLRVDLGRAAISSLVIDPGGWLPDNQEVVFSDIFRIGADAIMLRALDCLRLVGTVGSDVIGVRSLTKKAIYTETGLYLGMLADVYFEMSTGELVGYEISDGIIADFLFGRKALPLPKVQLVDATRLLVPEMTTQLL